MKVTSKEMRNMKIIKDILAIIAVVIFYLFLILSGIKIALEERWIDFLLYLMGVFCLIYYLEDKK